MLSSVAAQRSCHGHGCENKPLPNAGVLVHYAAPGPAGLHRGVMRSILFLCVANSARSQMAEGIARSLAPRGVRIYSAGSAPGRLHPLAVEVMAESGIDISRHEPKGIDAVPVDRIGTVVTLCGEEACPVLPGPVRRVQWPLADPAAAQGNREARLRAFRRVRTELRLRVGALMETL
jgi:arsenate reductase